jgi:hypothetical protein
MPKGTVDVPTETLPPNQALRDIEAQELAERRQAEAEYIKAQRGSVLFAYVPLPAIDRAGQPVHDPKTLQQIMDGACLIWKRHWVYDNPNVPIRRRERRMQGFRSPAGAQRFLSSHAAVYNIFNVCRHLLTANTHRILRREAFAAWRDAVRATG